MQLNHTGYIQLIPINPQPYHICSQLKSALLEGPDASSKLQSAPGCVAPNMLPAQRTARHPMHRNELCVHPPAPALLSAAPFHSLVLPSFSFMIPTQKQVSPVGHQSTDCTVVSSASARPVIWERGSLAHRQLSQSHWSEVTGTHQHGMAQSQQWGQVWDTQRTAGSGHGHSASVAFAQKFLASLPNTEHPTQSTVTQTLPNACSEYDPTAQNLLFLPKGDSPLRQPLPKLPTYCAITLAALIPQGTFCHCFHL